ncbi:MULTISPECIES: HNH endonuclease signature motif containing protein [Actinomycetes]|uniref:HNH endonuclease signature motif containing protein n=1 Tax=Actinomycetes TaxID=1760 RepID=UPI0035DE920F
MTQQTIDLAAVQKLRNNSIRDGDCIIWTGCLNQTGYGTTKVNGKTQRVHRVAYELAKGAIPAGMELDHLCSVRNCINPEHLEPVSHTENLRRSFERGISDGKFAGISPTHCPRGHEYSSENTYISPAKQKFQWRDCSKCRSRRINCDVCGLLMRASSLLRHKRNMHGIDTTGMSTR